MHILGAILLSTLVSVINCDCPFANQAYDAAQGICASQIAYNKLLHDNGIVLSNGDPAASFWAESSLDPTLQSEMKKAECLTYVKRLLREEELLESQNLQSQRTIVDNLEQDYGNCYSRNKTCPNNGAAVVCDLNDKYRTFDGLCNNLNEPRLGAVNTAYGRIVEAAFHDGINQLRRSFFNQDELPSGRLIGNRLKKYENSQSRLKDRFSIIKFFTDKFRSHTTQPTKQVNYGGIIYAQLITHDTSNRYKYQAYGKPGAGISCCSKRNVNRLPEPLLSSYCAPIDVPIDDKFYSQFDQTCLEFIRAVPALPNDCKLGPDEFINGVTSFADLTVLYGDNVTITNSLREFTGGLIRINDAGVLPIVTPCTKDLGTNYCYVLGDGRLNQTPMLALWHSHWLKFHNLCARSIAILNPHWNDERIFKECREITIAVYQQITYQEWLPLIIGEDYSIERGLKCTDNNSSCGAYNSSVDAKCANDFTHGAFRALHNNIPKIVHTYHEDNSVDKAYKLSDVVNSATILDTEYLPIFRGQLIDPAVYNNSVYPDDLRNELFKVNKSGIDLLSIDVSRGRDVGVNSFESYVKYCEGIQVHGWPDLLPYFEPSIISLLSSIYDSVFDLDLNIGAMLEKKEPNVFYGKIGRCIVAEQFYRLKFGDRHFYSFSTKPLPLTKAQLREVNSLTIASLFCQIINIDKVPKEGFVAPSLLNPYVKCNQTKPFGFNLWKE